MPNTPPPEDLSSITQATPGNPTCIAALLHTNAPSSASSSSSVDAISTFSDAQFFASQDLLRKKRACSNVQILEEWWCLAGKVVLDVGCGAGQDVDAMRKAGASVIGVEPNKEAFNFGCQKGYLDKNVDYCLTIQELPEELNGKFDLVTIFVFSIDRNNRQSVFERITQLLNSNGKLVIGTEFIDYILPPENDQYGISIIPDVCQRFNFIDKAPLSGIATNSQKAMLICEGPKKSNMLTEASTFNKNLIGLSIMSGALGAALNTTTQNDNNLLDVFSYIAMAIAVVLIIQQLAHSKGSFKTLITDAAYRTAEGLRRYGFMTTHATVQNAHVEACSQDLSAPQNTIVPM